MKYCYKCKEIKDENEFGNNITTKDGLMCYCKSCEALRSREYKKAHPEKIKANKKAYVEKNKEIWEESRRRYRDKNKNIIKDYALKTKYGIGIKEYICLYTLQKGLCAICQQEEKDENKLLSIDHDHETGKIRGLLCTDCNLGLGRFFDNIEFLEKAIVYLKQFKGEINNGK